MAFPVTKLRQSLVVPQHKTPTSTLALSPMDSHQTFRVWAEAILVYKYSSNPAKPLEDALSRALVPYYPIAGRLKESENGKLQVACTGEGVWFVEAKSQCTLEDVNYLERPLMMDRHDILPSPPNPEDLNNMIFMMQITQFACGGLVMGIRFFHSVFDGYGLSQFVGAVAEYTRGLEQLTINPVWKREGIVNPKMYVSGPIKMPTVPLQYLTIDAAPDQINTLKNRFMEEADKKFSTFEVLFAKLWQCRTRAIGFKDDEIVVFHFFADVRKLLRPGFDGYYGNCLHKVKVTAPSGKVAGGSLLEVVKLIREAKDRMPDEFSKWALGEQDEDPSKVELNYNSLSGNNWTHLGLLNLDFGWGMPINAGPQPPDNHAIPLCMQVKPPAPMLGARLLSWCVEPQHYEKFHKEIMHWE